MTAIVSKIVELKGHSSSVYCLTQGQSNHTIFTGGGDKVVAEWDLIEGIAKGFSVKVDVQVYALLYLKETNILIIGQGRGGLHVIDLSEKKEIKYLTYHEDIIFDLQYCTLRNTVYCACNDGSVSIWDANDFILVKHIPICYEKIRSINFNADFTNVAMACGDGTIRIYDTKNHEELAILKGHESAVNCLIYHPFKPLLISGGKDAHLRFWNIEDGYKLINSIPAHNFALYSLDFSPNGTFMASASRDKTVKIWDANDFSLAKRIDRKDFNAHAYSVNKLFWSEFNDYLITTGDDRKIMVWDIK